jgi:NAD+ kinase
MRIHFKTSPAPRAKRAFSAFVKEYGQTRYLAKADVVVSVGGDGQALVTLKYAIRHKKPVFAINYGDMGFLANDPKAEDFYALPERIASAETVKLSSLRFKAEFFGGEVKEGLAFNEATVLNHNRSKSVKYNVFLDEKVLAEKVRGDGVILATPAGSTAYNMNAGGYVLASNNNAIALTPNNATGMPRRIVICNSIAVDVVRDHAHRGDLYVDDHCVGKDCLRVSVRLDTENPYNLLFDPEGMEKKIRRIQALMPAV